MKIKKRRLSLRGLRTFCAAARHESFRIAADELFITASAVSHQIKHLEQEIDAALFERTGRALCLTEKGQELYVDLCPLVEEIDDVLAHHSSPNTRSGLRVSVQPFFASEIFVPCLKEFTHAHPDIDLHIDTSDETSKSHSSSVDVSIRLFRCAPDNMIADRLFPHHLVPVGSPDFKAKLIVDDNTIVSDFPIIVHESRPRAWRLWSETAGIRLPDEPPIIRLDSMIAVARAAERGIGAALVPRRLSQRWFDAGTLVALFEHELKSKDAYYLVSDNNKADSENVQKLRSWVLTNLAENP